MEDINDWFWEMGVFGCDYTLICLCLYFFFPYHKAQTEDKFYCITCLHCDVTKQSSFNFNFIRVSDTAITVQPEQHEYQHSISKTGPFGMHVTACIRVLLQKLIVVQAVDKFPHLLWTRNLYYRMAISRQWTLFWVSWIQSTVSHAIFKINFNISLLSLHNTATQTITTTFLDRKRKVKTNRKPTTTTTAKTKINKTLRQVYLLWISSWMQFWFFYLPSFKNISAWRNVSRR
jgi:hypothetical protein